MWSQLGGRMVSMPSTLVETVSINYEDFNESFLTCGTCLCTYDGGEHTPKLLPCSHTVCRHCLERIANSQTRDVGTFRCPICRECITIPRGGVSALPPSFLVNQLLDLMSRQRREVIPKCSIHTNQDLLFCETCDIVFCTKCKGSNHNSSGDLCQHTVIPFSLAIKRMSEILLYKANECISKLNEASDDITEEMERLDHNVDHAFEAISNSFQDIMNLLEKRRQDMIMKVKCIREEKRKVLLDQLAAVRSEKEKVDQEIESLQYEVEVRNISKKISDLECKLDNVAYLSDPKENSFLSYECDNNSCLEQFREAVNTIGRVRTSRTFPPNCTLSVDSPVAHLKCRAKVRTFDYHGLARTSGGDPISVKLKYDQLLIPVEVTDEDDGTYSIWFIPEQPGCYSFEIYIFNRPIKNQPFSFQTSNHHNPVRMLGKRGQNEDGFLQPVGLATDSERIYVADTGNCRIKVLGPNFQFERALENDVLKGKSTTGIAMSPSGNVIIVNWRTSTVAELDSDGALVNKFSHPELVEPTNVTVNALGHIIVADNYSSSVFIFDDNGKLIKKFGSKGKNPGQFGSISAVQTGQNDDIIVADSRLQVFDCKGGFVREIYSDGKDKGQFGGVTYDGDDRIICSRIEKNKTFLMVFSYSGTYLFTIDSFESKLKRPSGLVTAGDKTVIVADLGNDCLKQYRYA